MCVGDPAGERGVHEFRTGYGHCVKALDALAAAAQRLLMATVACFLVGGLAERRHERVPFDATEPIVLLLAGAIVAWLVREIVRPRWRSGRVRQYTAQLPSTSGVDFVADGALVAVGIAFATVGPQSHLFGVGMGFLVVPTVLAVLRLVLWGRRPTAG